MSDRTLVGKPALVRGRAHLDLRVLTQYLVVCETTSLAAAARKMGMSTPAASQIVHRLERDLDVVLFERTPGGLRLTPAGALLRDRARVLIEGEEDAIQELKTYSGRLIPTLRLYMMDSIAIHLVNAILPDLMRAVSKLEVLSGRSLTHSRDFIVGNIDVLISAERFDDIPNVEKHSLCRQGLVAILPASVPKAEQTLRGLAESLPLIRFRENSVIDRDVETYLRGQSLDPARTIECGSPATMLQIIAGGHGWMIAPPLVVSWFQSRLTGLAWLALPPPVVTEELSLFAHVEKLLSMPQLLARHCRAVLRSETELWKGTPAEPCMSAIAVAPDD